MKTTSTLNSISISTFTSVALALLAGTAAPALAQQPADHAAHHPATAASAAAPAAAAAEMTDGEVRKVDTDAKKITIKHGDIRNLEMPPMTMVFQVKDDAMLAKVKAGDKIRFVVERSTSGLVVTAIEPAR